MNDARSVSRFEPLEGRTLLASPPIPVSVPRPMVRVAYMVPANRTAQPRAVESLRAAVRLMREWYADQMERHGFPGRTIAYETEPDGVTPRVWVVPVAEDDAYLRADTWGNVNTAATNAGIPIWTSGQNWLLVPEMHTEAADGTVGGGVALGASNGSGRDPGVAHLGSNGLAMLKPEYLTDNRPYAGLVIPEIGPYPLAQNKSFASFEGTTISQVSSSYLGALIHELTHGMGMPHDNRADENMHGNVMNNGLRGARGAFHPDRYPNDDMYLSYGTALALSTSRYLNPAVVAPETNAPAVSVPTAGSVAPVNGQLQVAFTASDASPLATALLTRNGDLIGELALGGVATSVSQTFATPFYTPGQTDTFAVVVYDVHGNRRSVSTTVTPSAGGNRAPRPFARLSSSTVTATRPITLSASQSTDPDGSPVSALRFEWDLDGDGTFDTAPSASAALTTSFAQPGVRRVRVRVTDGAGAGAAVVSPYIGVRVVPVPQVASAALLDETAPHRLRVVFNKDVATSIAAADLKLTNLTSGAGVAATSLAYDPATRTAVFAFAGPLPDGRYRARLLSAEVADLGAVPLDGNADGAPGGDYAFDFVHRAGDADHDGDVDFNDLVALAQNYDTAGGRTFSQGDYNYDGNVDFHDLVVLAQRYDTSLPPAPAVFSTAALPAVEARAWDATDAQAVSPPSKPTAARPFKLAARRGR